MNGGSGPDLLMLPSTPRFFASIGFSACLGMLNLQQYVSTTLNITNGGKRHKIKCKYIYIYIVPA